jgi:hypothetical protein
MNVNALHRRLMQDVLEIGNSLPLVITGGYAVQAHQLVDRLSRDIDLGAGVSARAYSRVPTGWLPCYKAPAMWCRGSRVALGRHG